MQMSLTFSLVKFAIESITMGILVPRTGLRDLRIHTEEARITKLIFFFWMVFNFFWSLISDWKRSCREGGEERRMREKGGG
jgi:hypothetical protein